MPIYFFPGLVIDFTDRLPAILLSCDNLAGSVWGIVEGMQAIRDGLGLEACRLGSSCWFVHDDDLRVQNEKPARTLTEFSGSLGSSAPALEIW